jgi:hypothetical protein
MTDLPAESRDRGPRLFTVDEANALLSTVAPVLAQLRGLKEQLDETREALERLSPTMKSNGHGVEALTLERRIAELVAGLAHGIEEIAALGIEIKDLDQGLIDFPSLRDGRVVYLCWRLGEDRIAFWHDLDAGFAGRQPL